MKKLLIATLALITALSISLAACDKNKDTDEPADNGDDDLVIRPSETTPVDGTTTAAGGDNNGSSVQWVATNDTIYVLTTCNIRSSASDTSSVLGTAKLGDSFSRTETNNKWDKITYNGTTAYILHALVTDSAQRVTFTDRSAENIILHVKSNGDAANPWTTNLRNAPVAEDVANSWVATISAANTANNEMKLIALSQDGKWAKVSYTGTVGVNTFNGSEELYVHWQYIQELNPGNSNNQLPG